MNPLLPTLFAVALAELGGRNTAITLALHKKTGSGMTVSKALILISALVSALAVVAILLFNMSNFLIPRATMLLLGLVLIMSGIGHFLPLKPVIFAEGASKSAIALRSYARSALSGSSGMIIFAIGISCGGALDSIISAALGGWLGMLVVCAPLLFLNREQRHGLHFPLLRKIAGGILIAAGLYFGMAALRLI